MKSRASRAVPFYIFSASSFFRAKWHKFCFLCAPLKSRRREKYFDFGTNLHRESLCCEPFRRSPSRHFNASSSRAYLLYSLNIYSLYPPHFVSFALLSFSAPSPRRPFSAPPLAQPSLPLPRSPHPPHPFDSRSKEISERIVRKEPFKTVTCALQTARKSLRNPPQKQKNADFLKFFESKSCLVQKVAVLLHSLTEKTGVPVSSERQQKVL